MSEPISYGSFLDVDKKKKISYLVKFQKSSQPSLVLQQSTLTKLRIKLSKIYLMINPEESPH